MGCGLSSSNVAFSFGFIEGWYEYEEVDVVVSDLVVSVGEGGSSSSNVAFSMNVGGEDDGGVGRGRGGYEFLFVVTLTTGRPPRSTQGRSSAASDVYKKQRRDGGACTGRPFAAVPYGA